MSFSQLKSTSLRKTVESAASYVSIETVLLWLCAGKVINSWPNYKVYQTNKMPPSLIVSTLIYRPDCLLSQHRHSAMEII